MLINCGSKENRVISRRCNLSALEGKAEKNKSYNTVRKRKEYPRFIIL